MPSSISNFERRIPERPWPLLTAAVALVTLAAAVGWEIRCRAWGYAPTLNNTSDLWADRRNAVQPDSLVIVGDSRAWYDSDLNELERGLGKRPIQLAIPASCACPVLTDLADDPSFHGTVICSVVPTLFFAPAGPPIENSLAAIERRKHQTVAQKWSSRLAMAAEEHVAFLKQEDLTLEMLLKRLPIPNRQGALVPPPLPPYFQWVDRERRAWMFELAAQPGPLQDRIKYGWLKLFTPRPPPTYVPREAFLKGVGLAIQKRFADAAAAVGKIRARGGKVVFVRFPMSGGLKELEDRTTPRHGPWDHLLQVTGAPGIYFEDYPELVFQCPEWSHLSGPDSVEFTRRLVPHLKAALDGIGKAPASEPTAAAKSI